MSNFPLVNLRDVVQINPGLPRGLRPKENTPVSFVPMAAVCEKLGSIVNPEIRPFGEVSKGFTLFADNDVLFAKITPCMENGKAAIARNLTNQQGAGSTEFFVLRPTSAVLPEFIYYFLRRSSFRASCKANFSGTAGQQRVPKSYLESVLFPLPPLDEQRRIVGLFDQAAKIRREAEAAHAKARSIIPALFVDTFGDPSSNPKGWPVVTVGNLLESAAYGTSQKANDRDEGIPMLRMGNVTYDGTLDTTDLKHIEIGGSVREKCEVLEGDILFNRTNSKELVGKTGLWDGRFEAVAASYFIRLRVNQKICDPAYLWAFMNTSFMKATLFAKARGAIGQSNINAKELRAFQVAQPPLHLQTTYAEEVQRLDALAQGLDAAAAKAEAMAASLSAEVFGA